MATEPGRWTPAQGRILQGVRAVLCTRSVREATVQHVLEAAGVSRRTFYLAFAGLDEVLTAAYAEDLEAMFAAVRAAVDAEADPLRKVRQGARAYLDYQVAAEADLYALQREAMGAGSPLAGLRVATLDALVDWLAGEVVAATGLRVDPLVFRAMLLGMEGAVLHQQRDDRFEQADAGRLLGLMGPAVVGVLQSAPYFPALPSSADAIGDTPPKARGSDRSA